MGMVKQYTKAKMHAVAGHDFEVLAKALIEVYLALKEVLSLTVVDAIESMSGNGPTHGDRFDTGKVIYGEDGAAIDIVISELMGMQTAPVPRLLLENELAPDISQIDVKGNLQSFNFQPPSTYRSGVDARLSSILDSENWLAVKLSSFTIDRTWYTLQINQELCERCGNCVKRCPSGAITPQSETFRIDDSRCVLCLCCKEMCPNDAIEIHRPFSSRLMNQLYNGLKKLGLF
jgi:ferredoxin